MWYEDGYGEVSWPLTRFPYCSGMLLEPNTPKWNSLLKNPRAVFPLRLHLPSSCTQCWDASEGMHGFVGSPGLPAVCRHWFDKIKIGLKKTNSESDKECSLSSCRGTDLWLSGVMLNVPLTPSLSDANLMRGCRSAGSPWLTSLKVRRLSLYRICPGTQRRYEHCKYGKKGKANVERRIR